MISIIIFVVCVFLLAGVLIHFIGWLGILAFLLLPLLIGRF